ncbi:SGNH/GDSL hydrolase family protein [Microbacterium sp. zg-YB36]|uniref:SGNH/GDSL hydrolase family protein n=1 Tax=Microbacterium sp. zg-YB36 TaxID=2969407 RepID=UPI00214B52E3|nr:SGNH/GDSL hydrolase family protein [Microbacterium sp. zg-YB36]MDL5350038.1 SGNH/GDSL hydrolase family protein [Microbacterium sp. zg-YB36]
MIRSLAAVALGIVLAVTATGCSSPSSAAPMPTPTPSAGLPVAAPSEPVYIIGDSWAAGVSADPGAGWVDLVDAHYGWDTTLNAQPGTGYDAVLKAGEPYIERVDDLPPHPPALVIVQGGVNDKLAGWMNLQDNAGATIAAIEHRYPGVPILMVGPATAALPAAQSLSTIDQHLAEVARTAGAFYISPMQGEWVGADNVQTFIDPDTDHPSNAGHAEYAARLIAAIDAAAQ